tara:strand:- start:7993 stop:8355 length:363 start_codon:yes stop_codon:yes gene_type:complete
MSSAQFPYSTGPEQNPINFHMNVQDQIIKYKDDEKFQKAPPILPFEIEKINEVLGNTFVSLAELRTMLVQLSTKQPEPGNPTELPNKGINKAALSNIISKIDNINELILDIPDDLVNISI